MAEADELVVERQLGELEPGGPPDQVDHGVAGLGEAGQEAA